MNSGATVKTNFKRKELQSKVDRAKNRWLYQFGAFGIKTSSRSMKRVPKRPAGTHGEFRVVKSGKNKGQSRFRRGEFSRPGDTPNRRSTGTGLHTQAFDVDEKRGTVKFGPIKLNGASQRTSRLATETLEKGGTITVKPVRKRRTRSRKRRFGSAARQRRRPSRFTVAKRPFVLPAGKKAIINLRKRAKGSIK